VYIYIRTAAGASVTTVAHYKTTDNQKTATAGGGQATVAYYISGATPGYTVAVDITRSAGPHTAACPTSFTPTQ